ncbi:MAG: hypothetical protein HRT47_06590 [Candidatus Caenarcaniphilales bacterium]|nr:hypothetical protein [Candidatus Caenarcaniphilales bacterium]
MLEKLIISETPALELVTSDIDSPECKQQNVLNSSNISYSKINPEYDIGIYERSLTKEGIYYAQTLPERISGLLTQSSGNKALLFNNDKSLSIELEKKIPRTTSNKPVWTFARRDRDLFLKIIDTIGFSQMARMNSKTEIGIYPKSLQKEKIANYRKIVDIVNNLLGDIKGNTAELYTKDAEEGKEKPIELTRKLPPKKSQTPHWTIKREDLSKFEQFLKETALKEIKSGKETHKLGAFGLQKLDSSKEIGISTNYLKKANFNYNLTISVPGIIKDLLSKENGNSVTIKDVTFHKRIPERGSDQALWAIDKTNLDNFFSLLRDLGLVAYPKIDTDKEVGIHSYYLKKEGIDGSDTVKLLLDQVIEKEEGNGKKAYLDLNPSGQEDLIPLTMRLPNQTTALGIFTFERKYLPQVKSFIDENIDHFRITHKKPPKIRAKKLDSENSSLENENILLLTKKNLRVFFRDNKIRHFDFNYDFLMNSIQEIDQNKAVINYYNHKTKEHESINLQAELAHRLKVWAVDKCDLDKLKDFLDTFSHKFVKSEDLILSRESIYEAQIPYVDASLKMIQDSLIYQDDKNLYLEYIDPKSQKNSKITFQKKINPNNSAEVLTINRSDLDKLKTFLQTGNKDAYPKMDDDIGLNRSYLESEGIPGFYNLVEKLEKYIRKENNLSAYLDFNNPDLNPPIELTRKIPSTASTQDLWTFKRSDLDKFLDFLLEKQLIEEKFTYKDFEKIDEEKEIGLYRKFLQREDIPNNHIIPDLVVSSLNIVNSKEAYLKSKSDETKPNFPPIKLTKKMPNSGGSKNPVWTLARADFDNFKKFLKENNLNLYPKVDLSSEFPISTKYLKDESFNNFSTLQKIIGNIVEQDSDEFAHLRFEDIEGEIKDIKLFRRQLPKSSKAPIWAIKREDLNDFKLYCQTFLQQATLIPDFYNLIMSDGVAADEVANLPKADSKDERIAALLLQRYGFIDQIQESKNFQIPLYSRYKGDFLIELNDKKILLEYHPKIWNEKALSKLNLLSKSNPNYNKILKKLYRRFISKLPFSSENLEKMRLSLIDKVFSKVDKFYKNNDALLLALKDLYINFDDNYEIFIHDDKIQNKVQEVFGRDLQFPAEGSPAEIKNYFKNLDFYDTQRLLLIDRLNNQAKTKLTEKEAIPEKYIRINSLHELSHTILPAHKLPNDISSNLMLQMLSDSDLSNHAQYSLIKNANDSFTSRYKDIVERTYKFDAQLVA